MQALLTLPNGNGPWPGVVITHGSPRRPADRAKREPMPAATLWFAEQGFTVLNLTRRGYGQSEGGYVEGFGKCETPNYLVAGNTTARDLAAAVQYLKTQSFADPKRIVVAGTSAGGWGVLALAVQNLEGVILGLNFAGGRGSQSEGQLCRPEAMFDALAKWGRTARMPTYWIYAENDHYWGPELPKKMFQVYSAGGAPAEFWGTPAYPYHRDGHVQFRHDRRPDAWGAKLAEFLKQFPGLAR
jgi:dienelactone hydrolase